MQNLKDNTYLPLLSSPLTIELHPSETSRYQEKIKEYKESLIVDGRPDSVRYVSFDVHWTFDTEHKPYTFP